MIDAHDLPSIQLVHKGYVTSHGQLPGSMWPFKLLARTWGVVSYWNVLNMTNFESMMIHGPWATNFLSPIPKNKSDFSGLARNLPERLDLEERPYPGLPWGTSNCEMEHPSLGFICFYFIPSTSRGIWRFIRIILPRWMELLAISPRHCSTQSTTWHCTTWIHLALRWHEIRLAIGHIGQDGQGWLRGGNQPAVSWRSAHIPHLAMKVDHS